MAKKLFIFVAVVIVLVVCIVCNNQGGNFSIAGIGDGKSLQEINEQEKAQKDVTTANVVSFAEDDLSTEGNMAQVTSIAAFEHMRNGWFVGADGIFTVSSQFGICCPTNDIRLGYDFGTCRLEAKMGNFTRNSVKTAGFNPQFQNDLILLGEPASVSNAMQLSYISKNTKLYFGHQGGEKCYSLEGGNYYFGAEQTVKNLSVSGGLNLAEQTTGYAAARVKAGNNVFTATANNIGADNKSFVLSYNHNNINVGKGMNLNLGTAIWNQYNNFGWKLSAGLCKGKTNLFAHLTAKSKTLVPGLGVNYKL
jgi:hypothetical protein